MLIPHPTSTAVAANPAGCFFAKSHETCAIAVLLCVCLGTPVTLTKVKLPASEDSISRDRADPPVSIT